MASATCKFTRRIAAGLARGIGSDVDSFNKGSADLFSNSPRTMAALPRSWALGDIIMAASGDGLTCAPERESAKIAPARTLSSGSSRSGSSNGPAPSMRTFATLMAETNRTLASRSARPRRTAGSKIVMSYCMASMECARNERSGLREASSKTKRALRAQSLELETGIGDLVLALLESEASFSGEIL